MSSVWVQLYYTGEDRPVGEADPIEIEPIPKNVNALKEIVITKAKTMLGVDVYNLKVYAAGTTVPVTKDSGSKHVDSRDPVPPTNDTDTTGKPKPLIVIAPKPQEQQYGK
jgi:hypothetical protein